MAVGPIREALRRNPAGGDALLAAPLVAAAIAQALMASITDDLATGLAIALLTTVPIAFRRSENVYRALEAGASGFLLKDAGRERLVAAIETVARGEALVAPQILERLVAHFVAAPPVEARRPPELDEPTERALEVLRLIGLGLSNDEIAARLYVSMATVRTHVRRVLAKPALPDRVQAVALAYETGTVRPGSAV